VGTPNEKVTFSDRIKSHTLLPSKPTPGKTNFEPVMQAA
jgi:hypothetical protein